MTKHCQKSNVVAFCPSSNICKINVMQMFSMSYSFFMLSTVPDAADSSSLMLPLSRPSGVIFFVRFASSRKKHTLPVDGKNAMSPFLNAVRALSSPESIEVSMYVIFSPILWAFPRNGNDLIMMPTVRGDKWRRKSHSNLLCGDPISNARFLRDTDGFTVSINSKMSIV